MAERIEQELALLRHYYGDVDYIPDGQWVQLRRYRFPPPWRPEEGPVAIQVPVGYPGVAPYGFYAPASLMYDGVKPNAKLPPHSPPFDGEWLLFSWAPQDWRPTTDLRTGSNLWGWCRSVTERLREGP
jgi:hypothetical protein